MSVMMTVVCRKMRCVARNDSGDDRFDCVSVDVIWRRKKTNEERSNTSERGV